MLLPRHKFAYTADTQNRNTSNRTTYSINSERLTPKHLSLTTGSTSNGHMTLYMIPKQTVPFFLYYLNKCNFM